MISIINSELYRLALERLCEAVGQKGYFSGTVTFPYGDLFCRFTTSVIVYRHTVEAPDACTHPIRDLVPVWWEFHTLVEGQERLNDFSFGEMRTYL